jgi:4-nitrophenyl phosphatase
VLVGLDTSINYTKLSRAFRYLHSNPECAFLATNEDSTFPSDKGLLPGAGAILSPLLTALGPNRPVTAVGKPSSVMLDAIKAKYVLRIFPVHQLHATRRVSLGRS